ncbi:MULTISPECIES: hypothetical protein [Haloferacaceae]|uniref:DUF4129 domain-containing protein n=1 Tax=Halorubrum glutamatedens TaxID=2707018 RepID=A0ABD5QMV9_9EURY|nr:hypothetical protein [Halobellus captivus]
MTLDGFSRFAVYGVNETDGQEPGDGTNETDPGTEPGTNETDGTTAPTCGDGQCTGNETWDSCPGDCPKPDRVVEAESVLNAAEGNISQGDPGYSAFQQAQKAYENENFERAAELATQALEQYRETQQEGQTVPWLPIIVGVLGVVLVGAFVLKRRTASGIVNGESGNDRDEAGLDTPAHEVDDRLDEVSDRVRDAIQAGTYPKRTRERIYELLNEAIEAVQQDDYLKAKRVLDHLENVMDENA